MHLLDVLGGSVRQYARRPDGRLCATYRFFHAAMRHPWSAQKV
jgi:hypothetical protein